MLNARSILRELVDRGVTDVVGLPDNASAALFGLLDRDGPIRLRSVAREGEAFALAAGLWIGGRNPVVVVQNTGLLESGDSLRGTAYRMRVPLVCLVTYRGLARMRNLLGGPGQRLTPDLLSRADLDSAALVTEPTLAAWGVPCDMVEADRDLPRLAEAFERAARLETPVAVLIGREMG